MATRILAAAGAAALFLLPPGGAALAEETETRAKPEKVCKTYPPPIGTRLGKRRVCFTQQELTRMDSIRAEARGNLERIQNTRFCGPDDCN